MTSTRDLEGLRSRLSAEQRAVLERRLKGSGESNKLREAIPNLSNPREALASFAQRRQWFLWKLDPTSAAYHLLGGLKLNGSLDKLALERSLDAMMARHGSLRTVFYEDAAGEIHQFISDDVRIELSYVDLQQAEVWDVETIRSDKLRSLQETPFDLKHGPLIRATLFRQDNQAHQLHIAIHHAVADHRSMQILLDELAIAYTSEVGGASGQLPPLPISYAEFSMWQHQQAMGAEVTQQLEWWKTQLVGEVPALSLQTDYPRRLDSVSTCAHHTIDVGKNLADQLRYQCQTHSASLFVGLLSAFQALLYRHTSQRQLRIGVPVANRSEPQLQQVVGFFVNTVVISSEMELRCTGARLLEQARDGARAALEHQGVPFDRIVEAVRPKRQLGSNPLFQVMFNHLRDQPVSHSWLGLEVDSIVTFEPHTQFDLALHTREKDDGSISASFVYSAALFERSTIARMANHYQTLLHVLASNPGTPICDVRLPDRFEARALLDWSQGPRSDEAFQPVHQAFQTAACVHPARLALIDGDASITYGALDRMSNRLAHRLIRSGVAPDTPVGIVARRSAEMVVGLLAILKAGGAYVPLDPELPEERIRYMIQDSKITILLVQPSAFDHLPLAQSLDTIPIDLAITNVEPSYAPAVDTHPDQLAYVIYTSGSTGSPKGAANRHRSLWNRLRWMQEAYALSSVDVVLQKTPFSFDVSVWEFFWPLLTGARLVMAPPGEHRDPKSLAQLIEQYGVTTLHFVPSMLQAFLNYGGNTDCSTVKHVICSGEALPTETANALMQFIPGVQLHNLYGPTEAAIDVTHWTCERQTLHRVPIGKPISNVTTHVLDDNLQMVPIGVAGELYLGGVGLARHYFGRPALTAERFIASPTESCGARVYRTGDLVRWNSVGVLEYLGRLDDQVKIRGFRIELGEVEATLLTQPEIREAVAVAKDGPAGLRLVGYVSLRAEAGLRMDALRATLAQTLPDYMVPSVIVVLESLPLNANGKIDRRALPDPEPDGTRSYEVPSSPAENALAGLWAEVLGVDRVGRNDNFFDLGGHSLMALRIIALLSERYGCDVPVKWFFESPTLHGLAARLPADALRNRTLRHDRLTQINSIISQIEAQS